MQVGMIGLGRMGSNLVQRLVKAGHTCVVYDKNQAAAKRISGSGVRVTPSIDDFIAGLHKPRAAWVMVPAGITGRVVEELGDRMSKGDIIVDGGNSYYRDDIQRARKLKEKGIHFIDCGTSGGVFGRERGYCLMIGGEADVVRRLDPVFKSIAPGVDAAPRTAGRTGKPSSAEQGYLHCGPHGAGHFVKMVHNGIEYGLMAAYAEGINILKNADVGLRRTKKDAETTPLRDPDAYQYTINVADVTELWRRGTIISSWLLDLTSKALLDDPQLTDFSGQVADSGEGRWTALAAVDEGVPAPVISAALFGRFESRHDADYANRLLSAMRKQFGGHEERSDGKAR